MDVGGGGRVGVGDGGCVGVGVGVGVGSVVVFFLQGLRNKSGGWSHDL